MGPGISIKSDVAHQLYRGLSSAYNQNYALWNASIGKKILHQRGEIQVYAFDLLAQNRAIQRNVNVAYVEDRANHRAAALLYAGFHLQHPLGHMTLPTSPRRPR